VALITSALAAVPLNFYLILATLFISLSLDSSARYAMNFRYWKRPATALLRLMVAFIIVMDLSNQYGLLMVASDPPQGERFLVVLGTVFALGLEFWSDLLFIVNSRGEGSFEIIKRYPGNVWVCRRKLRAPYGYMRNTHRIEAQISGAVNDAKNRQMVDQIFLVAYIEGMLVELIHANHKDYEHAYRRMMKTGRRPRVVQTRTFSPNNPSAVRLQDWLDQAQAAGYDVFADESN
jgi:hypothetical protein